MVLAACWGCYSPSAATNVPCATNLTCPTGQFCDLARDPPLCVTVPLDAAIDAALPCNTGASGCPAEAPICDPASMTCRRCTADAECDSDACSEATGACIVEDAVLYVAPGGDDSGACLRTVPCATITRALALVSSTRSFVRIADGDYTASLQVTRTTTLSGPSLTVLPRLANSGGTTINLQGVGIVLAIEALKISSTSDGIDTSSGTALRLFGVTLDGVQNQALQTSGGIVEIRQSTVANSQRGIDMNGGTLLINRSTFRANHDFPVRISSAGFQITSSVFVGNARGISIDGNLVAGSKLEHDTFIGTTNDRAVRCGAQGAPVGDSLFSGNTSPSIDVPRCSVRYSLVSDFMAPGTGNLTGDPGLVSPTDFHLAPQSRAIDAADPLSTEPTDFEGQLRPRGTRRDIGADEY